MIQKEFQYAHMIIFIPANSPWLCKVQTVMAALAAACLCDCLGTENFTWNIHTLYILLLYNNHPCVCK